MRRALLAAAALSLLALGPAARPARAGAPPAVPASVLPSVLNEHLHFSGAVGARYLWAPYLQREGLEYLYLLSPQLIAAQTPRYGAKIVTMFTTFDSRKYQKGFAATGQGTMPAEPTFNFSRLWAEGYLADGARRVTGYFGTLQFGDVPSVTLPLSLIQVGTVEGARVDAALDEHWGAAALTGNLDPSQLNLAEYAVQRVKDDRYNFAAVHLDHHGAWDDSRVGYFQYDSRLKGYRNQDYSVFVDETGKLYGGRVAPRLYARYVPSLDAFSSVETSLEVKPCPYVSIRPGYFYYNRDPKVVHLQNSNYFAPGQDHNFLFLGVEAPLPRKSDVLYAMLTTGANRFMAQKGSRFETGLIIRFRRLPFLP